MNSIRIIQRLLTVALMSAAIALTSSAEGNGGARGNRIVRRGQVTADTIPNPTVVIGSDTISMIMPQHDYGRYDRGLRNYLFIPAGQWQFGLTAGYGEFSTDDMQILSVVKDLDFGGKQYSIKPYVSYFIRHNQSIGVKMGYTRGEAILGSLLVDIDDDLNLNVKDVSYVANHYSIGLMYRNYVGLGTMKRFGVFNEVDLSFSSGTSRFVRPYDGVPRDTRTVSSQASLNFSPGVCVFIMDNVNFNVSFGVFGIHFKHENQTTDGVDQGSRFSSGANFKFNIFNINFGLGVNI